jgi:hypothetical protein
LIHDTPAALWANGTNFSWSVWNNPATGNASANRFVFGRGDGTNNSEIDGYAETFKAGIDIAVLNSTINARAASVIVSTNQFQGGIELYDNSAGIYGVNLKPWVEVDSVAYFFSTLRQHTSGNILELWDYYTTNLFTISWDGALSFTGQTNRLTMGGGVLLLDGLPVGSRITTAFFNDVTITNSITIRGNGTINNLVITNNLTVSNVNFTTVQGTIDPTQSGLTVKQQRSLKLQYPRKIDGAGCTYSNTNDYTAALFMIPRFSATGATNANYAEFAFRVPSDLDTSVDLTASLSVQLAGADTSAATYTVGMVSIANSSAGAGTPANYVTLTVAADGSGASGDIESVNGTTLTGWRSNMTANQWCLVRLQRDGSDASAVAQDGLELEIFYTSTQ